MPETSSQTLIATVAELMPQLTTDLRQLIAIPSVSVSGYPTHACSTEDAELLVTSLLRDAGCQSVETITFLTRLRSSSPRSLRPTVRPRSCCTATTTSCRPGTRCGDPTVRPTERNGAIHGRGAADTKSNIMSIVGALRAWAADHLWG